MLGMADGLPAPIAAQLCVLAADDTRDRPVAAIRPEFGIAVEAFVFGVVVGVVGHRGCGAAILAANVIINTGRWGVLGETQRAGLRRS